MSNNLGKLGSSVDTMVKPKCIFLVHNADVTTDKNSETSSKLCKPLPTDTSTSPSFVFYKTNDIIYKQDGKSVAMTRGDFIPIFSLNEGAAQKIINENKKKILSNRHC